MPTGKLVRVGKSLKVQFTRDGTERTLQASIYDLLPPLNKIPVEQLEGREVEFEASGTSAKRIRPVAPVAPPPPAAVPNQSHPHQGQGHQVQPNPTSLPRSRSDFVNPYNFLPAVPRGRAQHLDPKSDLADAPPVGHDRLRTGYFTGVIRVTLTTKTPLLIPDAARGEEVGDKHKTFPVRVGPDGKPYLAPTAVKGMLRSAYEAITDSRLGVFTGHDDRLGLRTAAGESLRLVPARVEGFLNGPQLTLYPGSSAIDPLRKPDGPMYAAWLPMYGHFRTNWGALANHGQHVWAFITPWAHGPFDFWNVVELQPGAGPSPTHTPIETRRPWRNAAPHNGPGQWVNGYVCVTNQNIDNKHDERVFFSTRKINLSLPVTAAVQAEWANLIRDYQATHADEVRQGRTGPPALTRSVWSRHVNGGRPETELTPGTLCHAAVEPDPAGGLRVVRLYPVMISRKLFDRSPLESLDPSLHPATSETELSPADRVFGWTHQNGSGAHRGQLRVGPVRIAAEPAGGALRHFTAPGLPLAILGQPKPQQVRFYLGDTTGAAQPSGRTKEEAGYDGKKQLRGRKVYPHHARLPDDHWAAPGANSQTPSALGTFREYLRPNGERDSQNRSVLGWVNPGTAFACDLHVTNLSRVELGALVWLLTLEPDHFHRLGLGKPLGFGSVRLECDRANTRVLDAGGWKEVYGTLDEATPPSVDLDGAKRAFVAELERVYRNDADRILRAFKAGAHGVPGLPVHYPRDGTPGRPVAPNPAGEMYEWFVANDADQHLRLALPELTAEPDPGLPILPRRGRR